MRILGGSLVILGFLVEVVGRSMACPAAWVDGLGLRWHGFERAWPSIRDSNVSTIITCVVLFWFGDRFGTSIMQGFALTLGIGVLLSMLTAFFASRMLMRSLARTKLGNYATLFVPVGEARAEQQSKG